MPRKHNGVSMAVYVSDLFDQVQGTFDLIAFNAPMRPDETELSRVATSLLRRNPQISRFLMSLVGERFKGNRLDLLVRVVAEARRSLNPGGLLLLAINVKEVAEVARLPGVRLLREQPLPGMEPQEVAKFRLEETP